MVTVPKEAVVQHGGHSIVFVQSEQGYQPVSVKLGATVGEAVEVEDGLSPGQVVVSRGAFQLGAELLKNAGGEALFAQPTEGERMDEEEPKAPADKLNLNMQTVIVIVGVAFLLGFGIAAIFLLRRPVAHTGEETSPAPAPGSTDVSPPVTRLKTKGGKHGNV